MKSLKVNIKQSHILYEILFSNDIFSNLKNILGDFSGNILFIVDKTVYKYYKEYIDFGAKKLNSKILTLKLGERNKNIKTIFKIIDVLLEKSFSRKDYIVAIGGGVTGDLVGFASSLFKRGVNLIQVPTTLLSMFDSCVGGKTGIDYKGIKNIVGTFYNPKYVLIDTRFITTLRKTDILGGFFEGLKHSIMMGKKDYLEFSNSYLLLSQNNLDKSLVKIIKKNIGFKLKVVRSDPTEINGKRKILNYGHTFGHALETSLNFKLGHGICVGYGIIFANLLSYNLGFLKKDTYYEIDTYIKTKLKGIKLPKLDFEEIYSYMKNDKKNEGSDINFILLEDYQKIFQHKVNKTKLKEIFDLFIKENIT